LLQDGIHSEHLLEKQKYFDLNWGEITSRDLSGEKWKKKNHFWGELSKK
jgi:hypothetical protein